MVSPRSELAVRQLIGETKLTEHEITVDLTSEVRWFFDGTVPAEVLAWFTDGGVGAQHERCDSYRVDRQAGIGVKQRFQTTLELKLRLEPPHPFVVGDDLDGSLEIWRRWSPADSLIDVRENTLWIDIEKSVIKRRFGRDGHELLLSAGTQPMTGEGCEAELATISANGRIAWTFALAAFGPSEGHHDSLRTAWQTLVDARPRPDGLCLRQDISRGYPEWITGSMDRVC